MLDIHTFEMNPFGVNTYIVYDPDSRQAALIDPGMLNDAERTRVDTFITDHHLNLTRMINTHLHIDHVVGASWAADRYGVPVSASSADAFLGEQLQAQATAFHMPVSDAPSLAVSHTLNDGDVIPLGNDKLIVFEVPGHSPGSLAFYSPSSHFVITGDALFRNSIGRTDLPGGNGRQLIDSIRTKLLTLPDDTTVYPGHGPATTIGEEKRSNPYL